MSVLLFAYLILTFITSILSVYLAWYAWQRPHIQGARFLALCLLAVGEISFCFLGLSLSISSEQGYFWARLRFLGLAFATYFFFLFVLEYTAWRVPKILLMLLGIPPFITQVVVWTALAQFFFVDWRLVDLGIMRIDVNGYQGWFNVHNLFAQIFLISASIRLLYYALRIESSKRASAWAIIFGTLTALLLSLPALNRPEWMLPKLTPIGLSVMGLAMAFALFRFEFFRVIPIAYDLVVQNIRAAVFVLDSSKVVLETNPFALNLLKAEKNRLLQSPIAQLFKTYFEHDFPMDAEEGVWEFQQQKEGKLYHYEVTLSSLKQGRLFLGYLLTLRDMSIYKEAEAHALALKLEQERLHLLSDFINHTSHDLRNPLSIINSSTFVLQKSEDKERRSAALERISEQSARIDQLLSQFHNFLRLENPALSSASLVSVQGVLKGKAEKYQPLLRKHQISLHYIPPQEELFVNADEDFLRQAVRALLDNAVLYNHSGGEIWLETQRDGNRVRIIVRDTGIGISAENLSKIFDSFYKVNEARSRDGSGAGIGLAFVQRVANLYRGEVQIESEVSKGTEVRLILPLAPSPEISKD